MLAASPIACTLENHNPRGTLYCMHLIPVPPCGIWQVPKPALPAPLLRCPKCDSLPAVPAGFSKYAYESSCFPYLIQLSPIFCCSSPGKLLEPPAMARARHGESGCAALLAACGGAPRCAGAMLAADHHLFGRRWAASLQLRSVHRLRLIRVSARLLYFARQERDRAIARLTACA